ncbi:hypothetical protein MSG28_011641 [Choristoneura fumiferana]|uniref:Uncharacterized protein n=1 Tax=Choristoneura fumiferana TaxID=7141 RepID=A0ACC0KLT2_CHOFU|nr:hypothetical protein MSG28_011641 [Choristoneura fumiferana]
MAPSNVSMVKLHSISRITEILNIEKLSSEVPVKLIAECKTIIKDRGSEDKTSLEIQSSEASTFEEKNETTYGTGCSAGINALKVGSHGLLLQPRPDLAMPEDACAAEGVSRRAVLMVCVGLDIRRLYNPASIINGKV